MQDNEKKREACTQEAMRYERLAEMCTPPEHEMRKEYLDKSALFSEIAREYT